MRSECGVLRLRLVPAPREVLGPARQALRLGCEELAARAAEDNAADGSAAPGHKSPRWSAERRASLQRKGRRASRKRPGVPLHAQPDAAASGRLSALRPPLAVGIFFTAPGRDRAAGTMCAISHGLFDIVRQKP
jgi:hypothetical protein